MIQCFSALSPTLSMCVLLLEVLQAQLEPEVNRHNVSLFPSPVVSMQGLKNIQKVKKKRKLKHTSKTCIPKMLLWSTFCTVRVSWDEVAARIEKRISAWTFLPKDNSEPLEVLQYQFENVKQKYNYFSNKSTSKFSEPLMATVLLHLSNVTRGGELFFPESKLKNSQSESEILSDCTKSSFGLRPVKGNAILFFNAHPNASPDESSSYARCPVLEGELWCATKFFHLRAIGREKVSFEST